MKAEEMFMMAGIFLIFAIAILLIYYRQRELAMTFVFLGIIFTLLVFFHHATDILKINW
jgi:hypothetical protein